MVPQWFSRTLIDTATAAFGAKGLQDHLQLARMNRMQDPHEHWVEVRQPLQSPPLDVQDHAVDNSMAVRHMHAIAVVNKQAAGGHEMDGWVHATTLPDYDQLTRDNEIIAARNLAIGEQGALR